MEDDDKTTEKEPTSTPPGNPAPEVPVNPAPHADDLRETVHALSEKVETLASTVQGLLPENKDETPVKKPWTHRRFGG